MSLLGGIGELGGNIAILAGAAGDGGEDEFKAAIAAVRGTPENLNFDMRSVTPEEVRMVAQLYPETYNAVFPNEAALAQDSLPGREAQLYVMDELRRRSQQGEPLGESIANQQAQNAVGQELGRGQQNFMNSLEQRGRLGPGAYFQARQGFGQEAANYGRDVAMQRMQQNIGNRLGALQSLAGVAAQERGQTIGREEGNANAINRLNEYVANMVNMQNRYGADARNQANVYNTETRQRLADYNSANRQDVNFQNQASQNELRARQGGYGLDRAGLIANAFGVLGQSKDDWRKVKAGAIQGVGRGAGDSVSGIVGGLL
jgi:hypothetical protein